MLLHASSSAGIARSNFRCAGARGRVCAGYEDKRDVDLSASDVMQPNHHAWQRHIARHASLKRDVGGAVVCGQSPSSCDLTCTVAEPVPVIMRPYLHGGGASLHCYASLPARWWSQSPSSCDLACTVAEPVPVIMRPYLHGGRASPCHYTTLPARF